MNDLLTDKQSEIFERFYMILTNQQKVDLAIHLIRMLIKDGLLDEFNNIQRKLKAAWYDAGVKK